MQDGPPRALPPRVVLLLAASCGQLIANLYFIQPIAALVAADFRMPRQEAGLLTTLPLAGYGMGLLLVVPLADLVENRRLILVMMTTETICLSLLWLVHQTALFLTIGFFAGVSASAIQVILPYASQLLPGERQGRAVATLVSGMMLGIMLARPASSFIADALAWRSIFVIAAILMVLMTATLFISLPVRWPSSSQTYSELIRSMGDIFYKTEILRRRAYYHAAMFGAFISFWTAVPLWLAQAPFNLSQGGIAWVALAGVAGAVAPPIASRLVDQGYSRTATTAAMILVMLAFGATLLAERGIVVIVVIAAIVLDGAVSANLVIGQRAIYALAPEQRGRMNAIYIAVFFVGGSVASAIAAWSFVHFDWLGVVILGVLLPLSALCYSVGDRTNARSTSAKPS
ncbi:MFS transporter [Nguyenibacter vanlangensis]|uniref:MFS transporter n=1 Tax=Nguyenibacter vanlangensis TaxID=1216886 RepID=A0A7Y7ISS2_9PROT|nr:MFS transporter [Nguyenibacter vanlangensis]NVN09635.1 MFS transporter [Nguyenibacter vanlangensis]